MAVEALVEEDEEDEGEVVEAIIKTLALQNTSLVKPCMMYVENLI